MKKSLLSLLLAAALAQQGQAQTASLPRANPAPEYAALLGPASGSAALAGTAVGLPSVATGQTASSAPAATVNPVAYTWPSATVADPYARLGLLHCGAPPACIANEDDNGRLLYGDPLLDWSPWASGAGWFGAAEVDVVGPAVKNRLTAPVTLGGVTTTVSLPGADLHWTALPRVELGYRLGQATGEFVMVYRGLYTTGSGSIAAFDAAGNTGDLRSRLDLNVIDLDYASRENSLGPLWDMKWRTGVRVATVFFDSTATAPLLSERETNNFVAAGVHFGLGLKRRLGDTGFALVGDVDTGVVLGAVHQQYSESIPGVGSAVALSRATEPAPMLEVRFGVDYAPQLLPNLRLSTGYVFERWWVVGETPGTQGEVTYQGVFVRGEWRY